MPAHRQRKRPVHKEENVLIVVTTNSAADLNPR